MGKDQGGCGKKKHGKGCKCKKCKVEYRHIKCVKEKTFKKKYDIKVSCDKCKTRCDADSGVWNAGVIPPAGSGFVNSPTNSGRYNVVDGVVHATTAYAVDGPQRVVKTDFSRAAVTLPIPASSSGNFKGVILWVTQIPDGGKTTIIRTRLRLRESTIAEIKPNDILIATNEDIPPVVRSCYQVWIKVTYDCESCCC